MPAIPPFPRDPSRMFRNVSDRMRRDLVEAHLASHGKIKEKLGHYLEELDGMRRLEQEILDAVRAGLKPPSRRPRRRKPRGGSEAVTVEPDRPKQGEGGAAAALEFDE